MLRIAFMLYAIIATTLAGVGVIAVLSMGYGTLAPILIAAGAGALLALPASWIIAAKLAG
jgi:hypothetical protein